jgi:subfamily B ATP-binding cassette protein MsbA
MSDRSQYRRLLSYVVPYWVAFGISVLGFVVYSLGNVLLADLAQFLLDSLESSNTQSRGINSAVIEYLWPKGDKEALDYVRVTFPIAIVALSLFRALGFFAGNYYMNKVARSVVHNLRVVLFDRLMVLPRAVYDAHTSGSLISKITFNVEQVSGAASDALKVVLREGFTIIGLVAYMMYLNWRLTAVFFAVAPLIGLIVVVVGKHFRRYSRRIQDSMGTVTQVSSETLGAFEEVRLFGAQAQVSARFEEASRYNRNQSLKLAFVQALSSPVIQTVLALALGILFYFALSPSIYADFTAGSLVAFMTAAAQLGKPIKTLSGVQSVIQKGLAAAEDIFYYVDLPAEPDEGRTPVPELIDTLEVKGLSFTYPGATHCALQDIDLSFKGGETVAIVGRSGSGKSTLVQLLARFYPPSTGEIALNGVAIEAYGLADYRSLFAVVSQRVVLFEGTIAENIAFGSSEPLDRDRVVAVAREAHCWEFIEAMPQGIDTPLGDGGRGLSGGQRQRLALARALYKDAPIVILDEATSALDTESEYYVQEALERITEHKLCVIIAHRMATIERADRVVLLDNGTVLAQGRHETLRDTHPRYAALCQQSVQEGS